jgi:hypothetical protein
MEANPRDSKSSMDIALGQISVDVSPVSSIGQTFSQIGHSVLTKGNDSFTHRALLVVNGPDIVFLLMRSG